MKLGLIIYFLRRAWANLKSAVLLNILTVATVALTMLVLLTFVLIFHNINNFLAKEADSIGISVYLKDSISSARTEELRKILKTKKEFSDIKYLSKNDALETFLGWNRNLGAVIDKAEENPFPASFEITLKAKLLDDEGFEKTVKDLSILGGVEDIRYSSEWFDKLKTFVSALKGIGVFIFFFLILATAFLISNTIRLNIYARRDEISIMRLVGATDIFIKMPFMLEGFIQGLAGTLLASGLLFVMYHSTYKIFEKSLAYILGGTEMTFLPTGYILGILIAGIVLGILGSDFAVRRFLRSERD